MARASKLEVRGDRNVKVLKAELVGKLAAFETLRKLKKLGLVCCLLITDLTNACIDLVSFRLTKLTHIRLHVR